MNCCLRSSQFQTMKTMRNGATLVRKGAAESHKLIPRCKDHPALVDDAAKADALLLALLPTLLELVELVVDVPVGGRTVGVSTSVEEVMSVEVVGVVTGVEVERDVVAPSVESKDVDDEDDAVAETGEEILVMAKIELVSPESPNTIQTISHFISSSLGENNVEYENLQQMR